MVAPATTPSILSLARGQPLLTSLLACACAPVAVAPRPARSAENTPTSRPVKDDSLVQVRYGIIGAGAVSDFHHVPGIDLDPRAKLVMVADPVEA
eukprot:COSAG06_NODE_5764_length_3285_cov_2.880414_1_plen_95_part_00